MDFEPMKWAAGGAFRGAAKLLAFFAAFFLSPAIAGLEPFFIYVPRVALAKPRFTLGFILAPASQAKSHFSCKAD